MFKPIYEPVGETRHFIQDLIKQHVDGRKLKFIDKDVSINLVASLLAYRGYGPFKVLKKTHLSQTQAKAWDAISEGLIGNTILRRAPNTWEVVDTLPPTMVVSCERKDTNTYGNPLHFRLEGHFVRWRHPQDIQPEMVRRIGLVHTAKVEFVGLHKALAVAHAGKEFPVKWHTAQDLPDVEDVHYVLTEEHVSGLARHLQHWLPRTGFNVAIHYTTDPHEFGKEPTATVTAFIPANGTHLFRDIYAQQSLRYFRENGLPQLVVPFIYTHSVDTSFVQQDYGENLTQLRTAHVG